MRGKLLKSGVLITMASSKQLRESMPLCVFPLPDDCWTVNGYSRSVAGVTVAIRVDHITSWFDTSVQAVVRHVYLTYSFTCAVPFNRYIFHRKYIKPTLERAITDYLTTANYRTSLTDKFHLIEGIVISPEWK